MTTMGDAKNASKDFVFFTDESGMTPTQFCLKVADRLHPGHGQLRFETYRDIAHVTMYISQNPDTIVYLWGPQMAIVCAAMARLTFRVINDSAKTYRVYQFTEGEVTEEIVLSGQGIY